MQRFINPYHFISLSDQPERRQESEGEKLTGSVTYRLRTRSELFIPNTSSSRAFSYTPDSQDDPRNEHKRYDFFSCEILDEARTYDDEYFEPVIPGSEIRGMIRSIYETLTNSCLAVLDGEKRIGKRTVEHFKPAILRWERGGIRLYPARDAVSRNRGDFSEKRYAACPIPDGAKVYFTKNRPKNSFIKPDVLEMTPTSGRSPGREWETGYLLKGNQGPDIAPNQNSKCISGDGRRCVMLETGKCPGKDGAGAEHCFLAEKHCAHVFYKPGQRESFMLSDASMETLRIVLDQYLKEAPESYQEYEASFQRFMNHEADGLPVYYSQPESIDYVMLSPACITREVYQHTVNTLVDAYQRCSSGERILCPACRLFGIVNSEVAQGSKIRFTDLTPSEKAADRKSYYTETLLTLDPLAVPHLENTEFYLKKPVDPDGDEVWFWTYDYYTAKRKDGQVVVKSFQPEISGRKFYWHNLSGVKGCKQKTALNRTIRTVRPGVEFTGKIYFDGISEKQLKQLLYILTYTSDGKHGYKLGTGKPLGLGSVELSVDSQNDISVRKFHEGVYECTHEIIPEKIQECLFTELGLDTRIEQTFELMTRYPDVETMAGIHYPKTGEKDEEEGFQWFMGNKKNYKYIDRERRIDISRSDHSPRYRIQTRILNELPALEAGKLPWLPANPESGERTGRKPYDHHGQSRRGDAGFSERLTGRVKFFNPDQNYGRIIGEDQKEYKITVNQYNPDILPEELQKGCTVTFIPKKLGETWRANQCRLKR